jgi:isoquinoline 1-oxidoreductase subunit beta
VVTVYSPHVELGQGAHTSLAQMLADELDADWTKVRVEQAPAGPAFANTPIAAALLDQTLAPPKAVIAALKPLESFAMRWMDFQPTWGSMTVALTGQYGMRVAGASVREALLETAAGRLGVPKAELSAANSIIEHAKSGRSLRYGELAADAAKRSFSANPDLKSRKDYKYIGKDMPCLVWKR